ncbi:MAG: DinB family protein [Anaerolineales bacterium]|nr:DinB family protein [Anaerolineales bacterium]
MKQQTDLRKVMTSFKQHDEAIEMFLNQHAMLHSSEMSQSRIWSFEDEIFNDVTEEQIRRIPQNCDHSIAWNIWHIARIEDVAMNMLVAGEPQLLQQDRWLDRMQISARDTGNVMDEEAVMNLSATIELESLRAYRLYVGRKTRSIVKQLQPEDLKQKVDPARLQQVMDEGAVVEAASGIVDYWGKRNIAGLLLMPATRHNLVHLNESLKLRQKRQ